jgi:hypothetical protein
MFNIQLRGEIFFRSDGYNLLLLDIVLLTSIRCAFSIFFEDTTTFPSEGFILSFKFSVLDSHETELTTNLVS